MLLGKYSISCTANYLLCAAGAEIGLQSAASRGTPSPGEQAIIQAGDSILLKRLVQRSAETVISFQESDIWASCTAEKPGTAQLCSYRSS